MTDTTYFPDLLQAARISDIDARNRLIPIIYNDLHRRASFYIKAKSTDHTLQATALINEAFLCLSSNHKGIEDRVEDRQHFLVLSAKTMRQVLRSTVYEDVKAGKAWLASQLKTPELKESPRAPD